MIITLGLAEVWFDRQAGRYLNYMARLEAVEKHPDRFSLHLLGYSEIVAFLNDVIQLLKRTSVLDQRVILTVSPIPLNATFTNQDVMVANSYSKSVLRAAAQEIFTNYDHVDYFPSYESVIHSVRTYAFQDDQRHVTRELLDLNVDRMVAAYTTSGQGGSEQSYEAARGLERAKKFREAILLYEKAARDDPTSPLLKIARARCLSALKRNQDALEILEPLLNDDLCPREALVEAAGIYRKDRRKADFMSLVPRLKDVMTIPAFRALVEGFLAFDMFPEAQASSEAFRIKAPASFLPYRYRAEIAVARKDWATALTAARKAVELTQTSAMAFALLGFAQRHTGDHAGARESFARALQITPRHALALKGLKLLTDGHAAADPTATEEQVDPFGGDHDG